MAIGTINKLFSREGLSAHKLIKHRHIFNRLVQSQEPEIQCCRSLHIHFLLFAKHLFNRLYRLSCYMNSFTSCIFGALCRFNYIMDFGSFFKTIIGPAEALFWLSFGRMLSHDKHATSPIFRLIIVCCIQRLDAYIPFSAARKSTTIIKKSDWIN